jgi:crotonobetainyl-CoA:carnitine CoA-transferase CaiB-like acyl-CoA transferase
MRLLRAFGVLVRQGPIATLPEVCEDPQLRANNAFQEVHHPVAGKFETVGENDDTDQNLG